MSKSNAIRALVGTLVLSMPAVAATISNDEVVIRLRGATETSRNHYQLEAGAVGLLEAQCHRGDVMLVYAVAVDQWGEPDYGNIVPLFLGQPAGGQFVGFFTVPPSVAGSIFKVQAVALGSKGFYSSPELTVVIPDSLILTAPPAPGEDVTQSAPGQVN